MPESRDKLSRLKDYVTIGAIIFTGLWALWLFYFKETILPLRAPQHVKTTARIRSVGMKDPYLAVEVSVSIANQSVRAVYVPAVAVLLTGVRIESGTATSGDFETEINAKFAKRKTEEDRETEEFSRSWVIKKRDSEVLGVGNVLADWKLHPGEVVSRENVMYVKPGLYDQVVLSVHTAKTNISRPELRFQLNIQRQSLFPALFSDTPGSTEYKTYRSKEFEDMRKKTEFGYSFVTTALNLWPPGELAKPTPE